ncbi:Torsin-1A-interacting protein 2 [Tupaia chinensis]|uniref:Torsin-1A-interacting protein 2 n=1 Tax=Tupaia chinensis TaxID=246437 RepID=L9KRT0_TUPCH|nr:Torsin-1A-interacting protein 2 [Tupaia chinensis]
MEQKERPEGFRNVGGSEGSNTNINDSGLRDPPEDSQKDLENDPSVNSQVQETTVTTDTTEEAHTPNPAVGLNKDHQEVKVLGPENADTSDRSESPDETNSGNSRKDETGHGNNQCSRDGEGHHLSSESLGEEPLKPDPDHSPSDKEGRADAHSGSSSAALCEDVTDRSKVSKEPPAVDSQEAQSPGHSRVRLESQGTLRRQLAPETGSHQQETEKLDEHRDRTP